MPFLKISIILAEDDKPLVQLNNLMELSHLCDPNGADEAMDDIETAITKFGLTPFLHRARMWMDSTNQSNPQIPVQEAVKQPDAEITVPTKTIQTEESV